MSAPEMTPEEIISAFMKAVYGEYSDLALTSSQQGEALQEATRLISDLRTTLSTVQRERDEAVKEGLRLTVELEQRTKQVRALEGSLHSALSDLSAVEKERDALRAEVEDLHSQLAQRQVSVPFPYQLDHPYCENCKR